MSPHYTTVGGYPNPDPYYISPEEEAAMSEQTTAMSLIERLRNPAFVTNPNGGDVLLDMKQTRETMDEAADLLSAIKALLILAERGE